MGFSMIIDDIGTFKAVVNSASQIIPDAIFQIIKEGVSLRAMDMAKVAMVDINIAPSFFEEYHCEDENVIKLGMDDLKKVLGRARKSDRLTVTYETGANTVTFLYTGTMKRKFVIPLRYIDDDQEVIRNAPNFQLGIHAELEPGAFKEIVSDMEIVGEEVRFSVNNEKILEFKNELEDREATITLELKEGSPLRDLQVQEEGSAVYATEYLKNFTTLDSTALSTIIEFDTQKPLVVSYLLKNTIKANFILAPREES